MKRTVRFCGLACVSLAVLFAFGCTKEAPIEETPLIDTSGTNQDTDDVAISLEGDLQVSDFVWQGLNYFYYWQSSVPALADSKLNNDQTYAQYINDNPEPKAFFESLKHEDDRFSVISDDYDQFNQVLDGTQASNGLEFSLLYACANCDELVGYVKYILKDSDAASKNIKRGDFFVGVNGTTLTIDNYRTLLFGDELTYTLNMASIVEGSLEANGVNVSLTKIENFESNPIQEELVIDVNGTQVGYLMYNQFLARANESLNDAFGRLQNAGITELVLDLRYNGGGSVQNCVYLASMITGQFTDEVFAKQKWNSKLDSYWNERNPESIIDRFTDQIVDGSAINSLNLNRIFILSTRETASASELIINGLEPYIEVIQIGEATTGKNVGSITVYDYVDNEGTKNPDHKYVMLPIVFKVSNKDGNADYANGLQPDIEIEEDIKNLQPLGNKQEPFLKAALDQISGTAKSTYPKAEWNNELQLLDPLTQKRQLLIDERIHLPF
ncbi:MAG: S41 family peptidase [Flavobacteriaceae bacterium]